MVDAKGAETSSSNKSSTPSFSSFPQLPPARVAAPSFDSFPAETPAASTSKRPYDSGSDEDQETISRRARSTKEVERRRPRHSDDQEKPSRKQRDREKSRFDRQDATPQSKHRSDRHRSRSRERGSKNHRPEFASSKGKERGKPETAYYNVPDLASGEIARLLPRNLDDDDGDPEVSHLPDYKLYKQDTNGDQEVRRYGRLYKASIPNYRRAGYGHLVGLDGEFRVTKATAHTGNGLAVAAGRDNSAALKLSHQAVKARLNDKRYKRISLLPSNKLLDPGYERLGHAFTASDDFIALPHFESADDRVAKLEHEDGQDYRSIEGLIKGPKNQAARGPQSDSEEEEGYVEEEGGESYNEFLRRRTIEFDRNLKQNPHNIEIWLELVSFQAEVHGHIDRESTLRSRRRASAVGPQRSLAEVKLAILEKAIDTQPSTETSGSYRSLDLHLAALEQGAHIWDMAELMKRWQAVLRDYATEFRVWTAYITFRQTASQAFTVPEIEELFGECISRMMRANCSTWKGSADRLSLEQNCLYLLLRLCLLLKQAGYPERALAAFQAMMELNFRLPSQYDRERMSRDAAYLTTVIDGLESFWDTESPRFGEANAQGWCSEYASPGSLPVRDGKVAGWQSAHSDSSEDPFLRWGEIEAERGSQTTRPIRTNLIDEESTEDPYSLVLFSDIRQLLFPLSCQDSRYLLVYSLLFFLGLPLNPPDTSTSTSLASDPFLHGDGFSSKSKQSDFWPNTTSDDFLQGLIPFETIGGSAMEPIRHSGLSEPFAMPFRKFPISPDALYQNDPKWFCLLDHSDYLNELDLTLIREVLAQARTVSKDSFLSLAYFSLEASLQPKSAVKVAKHILKQDSKHLLLWDAYARIERSNGKISTARKVYANALQLSQDFSEKEKIDTLLLWRAWAEMEWECGRADAAMAILIASVSSASQQLSLEPLASEQEVAPSAPPQILRTRQHYQRLLGLANKDDSPQSLFRHRISITMCFALVEYLSRGLDAAGSVFTDQISALQAESPRSAEEEEAHALYAKILYRHTQTNKIFQPERLRKVLEDALHQFPNNSIFLSLYLHNEARSRIENRVRRTLEAAVLRDNVVTAEGWLFAIYAELHINARSYSPEAVRSLFERAVEHPRCKSSVSLWMLYIQFETRQNKLRRAKGLQRRALVECPWAKKLYMLAFTAPLRSAYRSAELREVHRLMLEKGLRIHTDFNEVTSGWNSQASNDDEEDEASEDALYAQRQAEERLRLLPM